MIMEYVKGISIINPDEVEQEYYFKCIEYAVQNNYNHIQITGPIHDTVKGNIDGMIFNKKYARFNGEKDKSYVNLCLKVVNSGLEKSSARGIKTFMWHHELILPDEFKKAFPETLNENGDIEVSHPLVKDYLENKIADFFEEYPLMDGIVLTLHETKIPLLKLKNQKLNPAERVKFVTETLYNACKKFGKEMIVRPFASVEKDQETMLKAYSEISKDLIVMDKWTKFDWSLSLPDNDFFAKIKDNPFLVEGDIFGEYFGKGRLPIMFTEHIKHKIDYCNNFDNSGFVFRIDRNYQNPFASVNEVNLVAAAAIINGENEDIAVDEFFASKYGAAGEKIRRIMEKTEENQKKIFYLNGYYFTQGSYFPEVNHCKNHFFFEIFKEKCEIASDEWFIPVGWRRGEIKDLFKEKEEAEKEAKEFLGEIVSLKSEIEKEEYDKLYIRFRNLYYVSKLWKTLAEIIFNYVRFFETEDCRYEKEFKAAVEKLASLNEQGRKELGVRYYNYYGARGFTNSVPEFGGNFEECILANFQAEKTAVEKISKEKLIDYIICGSCTEGHKIRKEVNFSDTLLIGGRQCRIAGNKAGAKWSGINAHGWFSYELKVKKEAENLLVFEFGSLTDTMSVKITIGDKVYEINEAFQGVKTFEFKEFFENDAVRIRIDRINGNTPCLYTVKVKEIK